MEGSLRQAGTKLRLAVQLVDAISGAHLWAENYERTFSPEAVFELQDDLVPRIVSTVADMHGVLPRSMSERCAAEDPEQLSPYEAVLRSFGYNERVTPEELAAVRAGLERAVQKAPDYADCWAMLSLTVRQRVRPRLQPPAGFPRPGARRRAARRGGRAVQSSGLLCPGPGLFFRKEFPSLPQRRGAGHRAQPDGRRLTSRSSASC